MSDKLHLGHGHRLPQKPPDFEKALETIFDRALGRASDSLLVATKGIDIKQAGKTEDEKEAEASRFWKENPAPFDEFVVSSDHMNQPPLSARQRSDIASFLGVDPKRVFLNPETQYRIGILMWGKGSGKDWLCSMLQCWVLHILLCMVDPRIALGMPVGEPIDVVNVAYSAQQAKDVFFKKFHGRLKHWKWLWARYLIVESGRPRNREDHPDVDPKDDMRVVHIKADMVKFPFDITAHSAHSENESAEGKSPIFWIMDEADAFRTKDGKANGRALFDTLNSSGTSRFPSLFRGLVISYTRSRSGFMMKLFNESEHDPTVFRSRAKTWEVNPTKTKDDFANDYNKDPKKARGMYECEPPGSEFGFFEEDNVNEAFLTMLPSTVITSPALIHGKVQNPRTGMPMTRMFVGKVVDRIAVHDLRHKSFPRVAHVDGGLRGDRAGLIISHGVRHVVSHMDPETKTTKEYVMKKLVVDVALKWEPDPERGYQVSLNNIASVIAKVKDMGLNIVAVSYDQWNSASSIEALTMAGIYCEEHNINTEDYTNLRTAFNLGAVEIPCDEHSDWLLLAKELTELEGIERGGKLKVDHPPEEEGGSKDIADCLAGCWRLLNDPEARQHSETRRFSTGGLVAGSASRGGSPFAGTSGLRNPTLTPNALHSSVVGASIRQSQSLARLGQMVSDIDQPLPHANKKGQIARFPVGKLMRG